MTTPIGPSAAMNAKASGTPAKFEATPEKVIRVGRTQSGRPPRTAAKARTRPNTPPSADEAALTSRLSM